VVVQIPEEKQENRDLEERKTNEKKNKVNA